MSVDSCGAREIRDTADDAALGPSGDGKISGRVAGEKMHFTSAQPVHRDKWDHCHEAIELGVVDLVLPLPQIAGAIVDGVARKPLAAI